MNKILVSGLAALTVTLALPAMAQDETPGGKHHKGPRPERGNIFEKLDADKSGGVSLQEMLDEAEARVKERFEKMDENKDGQVTRDEFKPPMRPHREGRGPECPGRKGPKGEPDDDDAPMDAPDA